MMEWASWVESSSLAFDLGLLGLLGVVLSRLSPGRMLRARQQEGRLREIMEDLRLLATQAEGQARELDGRLAEHATRLQELLGQAAELRGAETAATPPAEPDPAPAPEYVPEFAAPPTRQRLDKGEEDWTGLGPLPEPTQDERRDLRTRAQIRRLAQSRLSVAEIARRLDLPVAEVRVLIQLDDAPRFHTAAAAS